MNIVEIKNLSFGYSGGQDTLKNINLTVKNGEFVCIVGENGSREKHASKMHFRFEFRI